MAQVLLKGTRLEAAAKIKKALQDKSRVMKMIGAILEAGSQKAFREQRFGDFEWPPRYPNQEEEPFISVAGAMGDFEEGATEPKARRFDRRPALLDRRVLFGSIRSEQTAEDTVEVGTTVNYAATHQWGLVSTLRISDAGKRRLSKWLLTDKGRPYRRRMKFLLQPNRQSLDTEVAQRPFLGVTAEMEDDIQRTVELVIAEAAGGNE